MHELNSTFWKILFNHLSHIYGICYSFKTIVGKYRSFRKRDDDDKSGKITLSFGDYTDDENKRSPSPVKM